MAPPNESLTTTAKLLTVDKASEIAVQALGFLALDEKRFTRFLDLTGLAVEEIRAQASEFAFQAGILEYLRSEESLLMVFCANANLDPSVVMTAHHVLDQTSANAT